MDIITHMNAAHSTTTETITLQGRTFTVSRNPENPKMWILTGKRGAVYGTMRHYKHPEIMFVMAPGVTTPFRKTMWLTDRNGRLEPVRSWGTHPETDELVIR